MRRRFLIPFFFALSVSAAAFAQSYADLEGVWNLESEGDRHDAYSLNLDENGKAYLVKKNAIYFRPEKEKLFSTDGASFAIYAIERRKQGLYFLISGIGYCFPAEAGIMVANKNEDAIYIEKDLFIGSYPPIFEPSGMRYGIENTYVRAKPIEGYAPFLKDSRITVYGSLERRDQSESIEVNGSKIVVLAKYCNNTNAEEWFRVYLNGKLFWTKSIDVPESVKKDLVAIGY